jgi:phosphoserine phosphatase
MSRPLCVDLDGTLIRNDTMVQSFKLLCQKQPLKALVALCLLCRGKWAFKRYIADSVQLDPATLPYNSPFIDWLKQQKAEGRQLLLVSATEQRIADAVAKYTGLFDDCLGSHGKINLKSTQKAAVLNQRFGKGMYDYCGNHAADYAVWQNAHTAIIVNASKHVIKHTKQIANVQFVFK